MKIIEYLDFADNLAQGKSSFRLPFCAQWEVTKNCNLRCCHCYIVKDNDSPELDYVQIQDIMDQLYRQGCLWLTFTGGEPFTRKDFLDIYIDAKRKGFLITLFTNGILLNPKIITYLKEYPPIMIEITFHSIVPETFEAITGIKGSFKRCMESIRMITENSLPLTLKIVGLTMNKNDIPATKKFIRSLKGVHFKFDSLVIPKHDGSKDNLRFRLLPHEVMDIETKDKEMLKELRDCVGLQINEEYKQEGPFRCDAGISSFFINAYGKLQLCSEITSPNFDLKQNSFREGFYNFLLKLRQSFTPYLLRGSVEVKQEGAGGTDNAHCYACKLRHLCCQCPAMVVLENKNIEGPIEYLCEVARLRQGYVK